MALAANSSTSLRILQKDLDISALNKANQDLGLVHHSLYSSRLSFGKKSLLHPCTYSSRLGLNWIYYSVAMGHADDFTL